jgi:hypothetical protein
VDTSVVSLSGTLSIANTAQFNGESNIPCPVIGIEVCAVNHFGIKENLDCATTDAYGSYSVAMSVVVCVILNRGVLSVRCDGLEALDSSP